MDKKVAIVSCYFQGNYGSQLQAFATQKILDHLGVANETICIDGLKAEINKAKYKYFISKIADLNTVKDKLGSLKLSVQRKLKKQSFGQNVARRNRMFSEFAGEMFKLSECYATKAELSNSCDKYAAVLVGSDQLWLPSNIEADYYTLNFVPQNTPKIAFATSFGISSLPKKQAGKASVFLKRIDHLSTRENSGQQIIKDLTGRDVPIVCDPTLLFTAEDWLSIQKDEPVINDKYIFCYFLGNNRQHRKFVLKLKEETGCKIVQLQHLDEYIKSDNDFADYAPYDIGPCEYLNLIRHAEYICADSFHGTVFSILHKKPFFTFSRYKKDSAVSTNSRLYSILELLSLEERFITGEEAVNDCLKRQIDYERVHNQLAEFRDRSKGFLIDSLKSSGISL